MRKELKGTLSPMQVWKVSYAKIMSLKVCDLELEVVYQTNTKTEDSEAWCSEDHCSVSSSWKET
jgi:hypothetical protein